MAKDTQSPKKTTTAKKPKATAKSKAATSKLGPLEISDDDRFRMIAEAAYLKAEQRGFQGDKAMDDWLQAEIEVDARHSQHH